MFQDSGTSPILLVLYVAVVSDNDGSAFITKAEFDSLKNNFQAQIDNYNQSIDSKIDGAIASYLAGIKVHIDEDKLYEVYGSNPGRTWMGMSYNKFRLVAVDAGICQDTQAWATYVKMPDSLNPVDLGFGPAYWVTNISNDAGTVSITGAEDVGFAISELYGLGASSKQTFRYKNSSGTKKSKSFSGVYPSCPNYIKEMANKQLSIAFNKPIYLCEGEFPLYKFFNAGDVAIRFGYVKNGYEYEGSVDRIPGSSDGNCGILNGSTGYWKLKHMRGTTLIEEVDIKSLNEKQLHSHTFSVEAGDEVVTQLGRLDSSGGGGGNYLVFYFDNQLVGWEVKAP